jgi:hypothetical protein
MYYLHAHLHHLIGYLRMPSNMKQTHTGKGPTAPWLIKQVATNVVAPKQPLVHTCQMSSFYTIVLHGSDIEDNATTGSTAPKREIARRVVRKVIAKNAVKKSGN